MRTAATEISVQPFSIRLHKVQRQRLNAIALAQNRSAHAIALKALETFIQAEEARLDYERQAVAAFEKIQATGMHMRPEELKIWAKNLSTSKPKPLPTCRA